MATDLHQLPREVADLIARGKLIDAIKLLREAKGIGLREAKQAIDAARAQGQLKLEERASASGTTRATEPPPSGMSFEEAHRLTPDEANRIVNAAFAALLKGDWREASRLFKSLSAAARGGVTPPRMGEYARTSPSLMHRGLAPGEVPRHSEWPVVAALIVLVLVGWLAFA